MMMEHTDAELIVLFLRGEEKAFEALVARYSGQVYRFVYRLTGNKDDAYDITQEVFVKVWKNLMRFDQSRKFSPWLFTIARTTVIDTLRKKKDTVPFSSLDFVTDVGERGQFEAMIPDPAPLPDDVFDRKELGVFLEAALRRLSMDYRTVLLLHLYENLTFEEIAQTLDKPMNTVKSQYRRAILALRKELG